MNHSNYTGYWLSAEELLSDADLVALFETLRHLSDRAVPRDGAYIRQCLSHGTSIFVMRDPAGKIIATGALTHSYVHLEHLGYIHDVVVHPDARGRGLSRIIMTGLIENARKQGCEHLELTSSDKREAALALYYSLGFTRRETNVLVLPLEQT